MFVQNRTGEDNEKTMKKKIIIIKNRMDPLNALDLL